MLYALILAWLGLSAAESPDYVPEPQPCPSDLTVGCYYFPGHFSPFRWTPMRDAGFPVPVLGYYRDGDPEVSDWHVKWAVEHGIDFFAFDWYCHYETGPSPTHNKALDEGFLRARYRDHMDFCLMWCNEGGEERYTEDQIRKLSRTLTDRYFSQPNHLKIDGDNVLIVSRPDHFLASFGEEGTARMFEEIDAMSRAAGCGGFFPISKGHNDQAQLKRAGFRAITAYNYPQAGMTEAQREAGSAPYADMVRGMEDIWKDVTDVGVLPYIVPVSPGWDSRPWYGDRALVRTNPSPRLYRDMCMASRRYVDPKLNMVIAECWNEFGEGSYVEPTLRYGFGSLDAMRDAYCPDNPYHEDATPQSVGRPAPVFDAIPGDAADLLARGDNLLFNGDMESGWGWWTYTGKEVRVTDVRHEGNASICIPNGQGAKTEWRMPIPESRTVRVTLWYGQPEGSTTAVKAALFKGTRWLGRYAEVTALPATNGEWKQLETTLKIDDAEVTAFNLEFIARGGACYVDDVDVRAVTGN
ncbi:MAG: hypothetical protein GY851_13590 [bacterium]|nr:hypothetical protein [bacterium]